MMVALAYNRTRFAKNNTMYRAYNPTIRTSNRFLDCNKCASNVFNQYKSKQAVKPERTHHCSICKLCNLKMDHHCPFVQNCVGLHNHRFFVQMLIYTLIGGIFSIGQMALAAKFRFFDVKPDLKDYGFYLWAALNIVVLIIQLSHTITAMFMGVKHVSMIYDNLNTLESMKVVNRDLYDLGKLYNFKDFFGNFIHLLLPLKRQQRYEGYFFHSRGHDPEFQNVIFAPESLKCDPLKTEENPGIDKMILVYKDEEARTHKKIERQRIFVFNSTKIAENS